MLNWFSLFSFSRCYFVIHANVESYDVFHTYLDIESNTLDHLDNNDRTPLFKIAKGCATRPCTEVSVPVTASSAGLIYMSLHPSSTQDEIVPQVSEIVDTLPHVQMEIQVSNFAKTW